MDVHALCLCTAAERLDNLCPDRADGAELCNLQEEVRAHRELEHDLAGRLVNRKAACHEFAQVRDGRADRIGRLLHIVRAAAAVDVAAREHRAQARRILQRPFCGCRHFVIEHRERLVARAVRSELADRVGRDEAAQILRALARGFERRRDEREHRQRRAACIDVERIFLEIEAIQEHMHVIERREAYAALAGRFRLARIDAGFRRVIEHDVVDGRALVRLVLQEFVRVLWQRLVAGLRDAPWRLDVACR